MIRKTLYKILDYPLFYNIFQRLASTGRMKAIRFIEEKIKCVAKGMVCDLGCGPGGYAHLIESNYYGIDLDSKYLSFALRPGKYFICADAASLPFGDKVFEAIFSVGFFHHLDNNQTKATLSEVSRVMKNDARLLVVDIFYPENRFNVFGYFLSRFDRGRYVRKLDDFCGILKENFITLESAYIKRSFPQNMRYFLLKRKVNT